MLFPAHAGVILNLCAEYLNRPSFPRPRGGDPGTLKLNEVLVAFSPPTRG